jgi:hypothetical protein
MAQAAKAVRRSRSTRKTTAALLKIETMAQLVSALGGAKNIAEHISSGDQRVVIEWFEHDCIRRGHHLQIMLSLMARGYTLDTIRPELFDRPKWTSYTVPVDTPRGRLVRR